MHILVEFLRCFHTCVMHNVAGQPMKYMVGFFTNTLVRMEFLFSKLTDVLPTETPTQLWTFSSEKAPTACQQLPLFSMICIEFK